MNCGGMDVKREFRGEICMKLRSQEGWEVLKTCHHGSTSYAWTEIYFLKKRNLIRIKTHRSPRFVFQVAVKLSSPCMPALH